MRFLESERMGRIISFGRAGCRDEKWRDARLPPWHTRVKCMRFRYSRWNRRHDRSNPYAPPASSIAPPLPKDNIARQIEGIQYPLMLSFKIIALASQATVTDANGRVVLHTKQKLLKFREHVEIFTDNSRATLLAEIKANKVIDWSARYAATRTDGTPAMRLTKQPAFWEGRFQIDKLGELNPREELNLFLSFLMLVLLERSRG